VDQYEQRAKTNGKEEISEAQKPNHYALMFACIKISNRFNSATLGQPLTTIQFGFIILNFTYAFIAFAIQKKCKNSTCLFLFLISFNAI